MSVGLYVCEASVGVGDGTATAADAGGGGGSDGGTGWWCHKQLAK